MWGGSPLLRVVFLVTVDLAHQWLRGLPLIKDGLLILAEALICRPAQNRSCTQGRGGGGVESVQQAVSQKLVLNRHVVVRSKYSVEGGEVVTFHPQSSAGPSTNCRRAGLKAANVAQFKGPREPRKPLSTRRFHASCQGGLPSRASTASFQDGGTLPFAVVI